MAAKPPDSADAVGAGAAGAQGGPEGAPPPPFFSHAKGARAPRRVQMRGDEECATETWPGHVAGSARRVNEADAPFSALGQSTKQMRPYRRSGVACGFALAHTTIINTPSPYLGHPITAGLPRAARISVVSSVIAPRTSLTRMRTVSPATDSGSSSSRRSPGTVHTCSVPTGTSARYRSSDAYSR